MAQRQTLHVQNENSTSKATGDEDNNREAHMAQEKAIFVAIIPIYCYMLHGRHVSMPGKDTLLPL